MLLELITVLAMFINTIQGAKVSSQVSDMD